METVIGAFMLTMGTGIAAIWTRDIVIGDRLDLSVNRRRARDPDSGSLLLPHWVAEYGTAVLLIVGGIGLLADWSRAVSVSLVALGALVYTSMNSLGWAFADRRRYVYGIPMLIGAIGGVVSVFALLT